MKRLLSIRSSCLLAIVAALSGLHATGQETAERFQAGQWDLSPFATYVDKAGDNWGVGAAVTYYVTKNVGVGGSTYWTDFSGAFIDNLNAEGYFRIPIGNKVSPYAVGSVGYAFESSEWTTSIGGGVDFRFLKRISAFSDLQWRIAQDTRDGAFLRLGARIAF